MQRFKVTVGSRVFEVAVEPLNGNAFNAAQPAAQISPATVVSNASAAKSVATPSIAGATPVSSPLAGKVVAIDISQGEQVQAGDRLITIEAMKMNTYVYAPSTGCVVSVNVNVGDGVEQGQLLAQIKA